MSTLVSHALGRLTSRNALLWAGVLLFQVALAALFMLDYRIPAAVVLAVAVGVVALLYPLVAVGALITGRILATGSMSFLRIGGLNIGVFEPMLALALAVLFIRAMNHRLELTPSFPWRAPMLGLLAWQVTGLIWCHKIGGGLTDIVAVGVILCTSTILMVFIKDYVTFERVVLMWIGATLLTAVLSMTTDFSQVEGAGKTWEIASGGGRETGLGQQPNWFAMNLMFGVPLALAMSVIQKKTIYRVALVGVGLFILFAQLRSGSRGGTYALVIGAVLMSMAQPLVRKWMLRIGVVVAVGFAFYMFFGDTSTQKAFTRIAINVGNTWSSDIRERNWMVCFRMFKDTWGFGIGPGSYATLVADYDWKIYDSIHRYPHGIFWGIMGHYGLVGITMFFLILRALYRMLRDLVTWTKGTTAEVFAWAMPATMVGYIMWSFVEFNWNDKPFWEYLALYTCLWLVVKRARENGEELPALPGGAVLPWARTPEPTPEVPVP